MTADHLMVQVVGTRHLCGFVMTRQNSESTPAFLGSSLGHQAHEDLKEFGLLTHEDYFQC